MTQQEEALYNTLVNFKQGHDKLYVIMEELEDLIKSDYTGSFNSPDLHGLLSAFKEYKQWELEQRKKQSGVV